MHSDLIADLLTRVRNASRAGIFSLNARYNGSCMAISQILVEEGYIKSAKKTKDANDFDQITLELDTKKVIDLKRISKPGQRIYKAHGQVPKVLNGLGMTIVSTSKGVMTAVKAHGQGVGGEVLCEVW
ncbi:30S ribosomal protein S8 [Candidatus Gracilibacteria bacterium]|jgi:small subunit ribosomal protein S8|nr:30S ribosomal protein S8 [Candidatus Gracilibacteria bacterium]